MADGHGGRIAGTGGYTMLGESPCDQCKNKNNCGKNGLACGDYLEYVNKGNIIERNRVPTTDCYLRINSRGKTKHQQKASAGKEEGRTKKESSYQKTSCQKARSQTQSTSQKEINQKEIPSKKARIKACITQNKESISQIIQRIKARNIIA